MKKLKRARRQFLRDAGMLLGAASLPALAPSRALGRDDQVAASNRVVVGCVGVGWQGVGNLKAFLKDPNVQVAALCDIDLDHLKEGKELVDQKYGNTDCAAYHVFEELFARPDIDAVVLSVPDHWHALAAIPAIRAGKAVYGEKPLAHNWAEGQAICDAVNLYGTVWQTGSWQRSLSSFRLACELVRNGRIGKVSKVEVGLRWGNIDFAGTGNLQATAPPPPTLDYDRWLGPAPYAPYCPARVHKNWRYNYDYGGGSLMDWVGHHVDIAHWGLDLDRTGPNEVEAEAEFPTEGSIWNTAIKYRVTARYKGDITMVIDGGKEGFRTGTKWVGDEGWIWIDRSGMEAEPKRLLRERIRPNEIHLPHSPGHQQQFIECVKTRRPTLTPCDVALRSATPGYLGQIAMLTGRKIRWDPKKQEILDDPVAQRMLFRSMRSPWYL